MPSSPVAIVTGGGRNLGKAIAMRLAEDGFDVVIAGPDQEEVEKVAGAIKAFGRRSLATVTDVTAEHQAAKMAERAWQAFAQIDVLVNNAGIIGPHTPVERVTPKEWNDVLAVNLTGAFLCSRAVIPLMKEQRRGCIINIASIAGKIAYPLRSPYAVSKWGM